MNVFISGFRHHSWVWQVTGLCFILGLLLAGSLQTVNNINRTGTGFTRVGGLINSPARVASTGTLQEEIKTLRDHNTKLENTLAQGNGQAKALNEELQKVKLLAGLTAVHGKGVVMVLMDSHKPPPTSRLFDQRNLIIHDYDLQQAVHELYASKAEAISINGQRLVGRTAIRCAGPTTLINGEPVSSPFEIRAIGDPGTIMGGLSMPGGYLDSVRAVDPGMVKIEQRDDISLPAYTGSTETHFCKAIVTNDTKAEKVQGSP